MERVVNVVCRDIVCVVRVELLEERLELLLGEEALCGYGSREKLRVVDLLVAVIIHLADNTFDV